MEFKEALKIMRTELKMTQSELAKIFDITQRTISRWEVGASLPHAGKIDEILDIVKKLDISERCKKNVLNALYSERQNLIQVPKSKLYPVDKESICDLVDKSHNAIYVTDLETDEMLYANAEAERFAERKFVLGDMCYHFLYGRTEPCLQCPKLQMSEDGSTDYHLVSTKNGRHYHFRGRRLIWNGRSAHAEYFFEEKTDLEAADGFHTVVDEMDMGVCTYWVHDNGYIQMNYMSDGYFTIIGSTRETRTQYAGFGVMNAVYEADQERVRETVLTASKEQRSFRMRYKVLTYDGGLKNLSMRAKFIRRENHKSLYYCMVEDADWGIDKEPFGGKVNGI